MKRGKYKSWSTKEKDEVLDMYQKGIGPTEISYAFDVSKSSIMNILNQNNSIKARWKPTKEEYEDMKNYIFRGYSFSRIAAIKGLSLAGLMKRWYKCKKITGGDE